MTQRFKTLFALLLVATGIQAQLLWKISGNGLTKPSYVIGTYHLAPASFADSIVGLNNALSEAEQVYGELDMSNLQSPETIGKIQAAMSLPEGTSFETLFTAEQTERINAFMRQLMGVDMSNPMVASQLKAMKPATLTTQFTLLMFLKKYPDIDVQNLFDEYFQKKAAEANKPIGGLESLELQMHVLYESKSLQRQAEELMCLVDNQAHNEKVADMITKAFYAQDLKAIEAAGQVKLHTACDATPKEEATLIYHRNADWAKKMPGIMQQRATFFAVGALHLPGEKGLIELLRKAGFTLEAVK